MFKNIIGLFALSSCLFLVACGGDGEGAAPVPVAPVKTAAGTYTGTISNTSGGSAAFTGPVSMTITNANTMTGTMTLGAVPSNGVALLIDLSGTVDSAGKLTATGTAGTPPQNLLSMTGNVDVAKGVVAGSFALTFGSDSATGIFSLTK